MAKSIPCDGNRVTWYRWRRRVRWLLLWESGDDRHELDDLLRDISQRNAQDLEDQFTSARCEPASCRKNRGSIEVADPEARNSFIRCYRVWYTLFLGIRCVVYARHKLEVWCDPYAGAFNQQETDEFQESGVESDGTTKVEVVALEGNTVTLHITDSPTPVAEMRWIQVVVKTNPKLPDATRPNFDCCITKGEEQAGHLDGGERDRRKQKHNPFFVSPSFPAGWFSDSPWDGYGYFETYITLCRIETQANPEKWRAIAVRTWHWVYEAGKPPALERVRPDDNDSVTATNGAVADFDNAFLYDTWYDGKPP